MPYSDFVRSLKTPLAREVSSVIEYFLGGILVLSGVQAIIGFVFRGESAISGAFGPPASLLATGIVFLLSGLGFLYVKITDRTSVHGGVLFWTYCCFLFSFIAEVMLLPQMVGLWTGPLILALISGTLYLRTRLIKED